MKQPDLIEEGKLGYSVPTGTSNRSKAQAAEDFGRNIANRVTMDKEVSAEMAHSVLQDALDHKGKAGRMVLEVDTKKGEAVAKFRPHGEKSEGQL